MEIDAGVTMTDQLQPHLVKRSQARSAEFAGGFCYILAAQFGGDTRAFLCLVRGAVLTCKGVCPPARLVVRL